MKKDIYIYSERCLLVLIYGTCKRCTLGRNGWSPQHNTRNIFGWLF